MSDRPITDKQWYRGISTGFDEFIRFNITGFISRARVRISRASEARIRALGYRDMVRVRNFRYRYPQRVYTGSMI